MAIPAETTSVMPTIIFFGNERIATGVTTTAPTLSALLSAGYTIACLVIAQGETSASRQQRKLEVLEIAERHCIPVMTPQKLSEITEQLASYQADAGVLVAFGKLVPQSIIDLFPAGIINIHPSLLPLHRGSMPLESALLQGDTATGVSLMGLVSKMDAGPVYAQQTIALVGNETKQALADTLLELGGSMLLQCLPEIIAGSLVPSEQDDAAATYDARIEKTAGVIGQCDWNQPVAAIERKIRAYAGWPRVRTRIGTTDVIITAAHVYNPAESTTFATDQGAALSGANATQNKDNEATIPSGVPGSLWLHNKQLGIHAQDGEILIIDRLLPLGKKEMSGSAFLAGYKSTT